MEKKSRYRTLYLARTFIGLAIITIAIALCFYYSAYIIGIFSLLLLIYEISNLLSLAQISIEDKGLELAGFMTDKKEFLNYDDISKIQVDRKKWHDHKGMTQIGVPSCTIKLKNKRELFISADEIDNFDEIVTAIRAKLEQSTSHNPG